MFSATGHIYCDFCGRSVDDCGPVATNPSMGGRCHICGTCALETVAKFMGGNCARGFATNTQLVGASHAENQKEASHSA